MDTQLIGLPRLVLDDNQTPSVEVILRNMVKALASAALVTALAAPVPAQAAQAYNNVGYAVNGNGSWTYEFPYRVRYKTGAGTIKMKVGDNVDGGVCVRLIDVHTHHVVAGMRGGNRGVCWSTSQTGDRKDLSYGTPAGTQFAVQAMKSYPFGYDDYWSAMSPTGWFFY